MFDPIRGAMILGLERGGNMSLLVFICTIAIRKLFVCHSLESMESVYNMAAQVSEEIKWEGFLL